MNGKYIIDGELYETGALILKETGDVVQRGTVCLKAVGYEDVKAIKIPVRQMSTVTDNLTKKLMF